MTSDVYDVFVNHEKSFREGLSTRKSLSYLHSHIYIFMNETHCEELQALRPTVTSRAYTLLIISEH